MSVGVVVAVVSAAVSLASADRDAGSYNAPADIHAKGKVGSEEAVGCVDTFEGDSYV